jgi:hypothetical protein
MSTLSQQIQELQTQLDLNNQSKASKQIINEYSEIYKHLEPGCIGLNSSIKRFLALKEMPEIPKISIAVQSLATATKTAFNEFYAKWSFAPQDARQGNELAIFENSLKSLANTFNSELKEYWDAWIKELQKNAILEEVLLESQRLIPGKETIYSEYIIKKNLFNGQIEKLPNEGSVVVDIKILTEEMIKLIGQMEFNLPNDVKIFFEHLRNSQYGGKAPLRLLTKSVLDWLEVNKLTDKFYVEQMNRRF